MSPRPVIFISAVSRELKKCGQGFGPALLVLCAGLDACSLREPEHVPTPTAPATAQRKPARRPDAPDTKSLERAEAAFAAEDYVAAEHLALAAANQALAATPPREADAIKAYRLVARAAGQRHDNLETLSEYRAVAALPDPVGDPLELARQQWKVGLLLYGQGQYWPAEETSRRALKAFRCVGGIKKTVLISVRTNLANAMRALGYTWEPEQEYRAVLALQTRLLGPEHPDTLATRTNLAKAIVSIKHFEAWEEFGKVIAIQERVLGPEHPDTLTSRSNLANALWDSRHSDQREAQWKVLALRQRILGPEHPDTLTSRFDVACLLRSYGRHPEEVQEQHAILAIRQRVLGPEHPDTLASRSRIALLLGVEDKHAESAQEYREVLAIQERVLPPDHLDVFRTCYNLASHLVKEYQEALALMQRAEEGFRMIYGPNGSAVRPAEISRRGIQDEIAFKKANAQ